MTIFERIYAFIQEERSRFQIKDGNIFAMSFTQIIRYRNFLDIINCRYGRASRLFVKNLESQMSLQKKIKGETADNEMPNLLEESRIINDKLQLEIESFYQFAKILLDRIANSIGVYFGKIPKVSFESHHKFCKSFRTFSTYNGIKTMRNLFKKAEILMTNIVDYRDDHIVHKACARDMHGITWGIDKKAKILKSRIYPKDSDPQKTSEDLNNLLDEIDSYINTIINLIRDNRDKTALKLK